MRATWLILGTVVVGGGFAYWHLRWGGGAKEGAEAAGGAPVTAGAPALDRTTPAGARGVFAPAAAPVTDPTESIAARLVGQMGEARAANDAPRYAGLLEQLKKEAWDAPSARRFAVQSGWNLQRESLAQEGERRVQGLERARRLLSRGVLLPEYFGPDGSPTAERGELTRAIAGANAAVMTWKPGVPGVTRPYVVPPGQVPVQIVSEERLATGHNALLFWNKGGNLDPKRLVAGETILLPLEELSVFVEIDRRLLILFLGDVWVRDLRVGVGKQDTPTPRGTFHVGKKQENPDWYAPQGGIVRAGDPRNELGSVWIHIANEQHPTGYGIHGTNNTQTVGTACSQGCVRLTNEQASEIYWWVRTDSRGGKATRVVLH